MMMPDTLGNIAIESESQKIVEIESASMYLRKWLLLVSVAVPTRINFVDPWVEGSKLCT